MSVSTVAEPYGISSKPFIEHCHDTTRSSFFCAIDPMFRSFRCYVCFIWSRSFAQIVLRTILVVARSVDTTIFFFLASEALTASQAIATPTSFISSLISNRYDNYSSTITTGPKSEPTCPQYVVGRTVLLKQVYWLNTTLGLTLDTISITVIQYNMSAITTTITTYGDVSTLDSSIA